MAKKIVPQGDACKPIGEEKPEDSDVRAGVVVRFPRSVKRGAKVRRGPCAEILRLSPQFSGEELVARYRWICHIEHEWGNEETEGTKPEEYGTARQRQLLEMTREMLGYTAPTAAEMRQRIVKARARIERRNRVKAWLESRGADLNEITTPEHALFFIFDRMHPSGLPPVA